MTYTISYQYATYVGTEVIQAENSEEAIAKLWKYLRKYMTLPMAYQRAEIIKTEN